MADFVISAVAKVAEYLVELTSSQGQYLFCVNKVIKDLENEKNELTSERDSLEGRVEQAKKRAEEIEELVEKWLNDVKNLLEEVEDLEQKMRANNNCFQRWCLSLSRYRLCKKMVKKIEAMRKFKGKSNIEPFSHPAALPGIQYEPSENFTYFESTKVAYNHLMEALKDDSTYVIGLYGMGGSGKTTLVTEVGKKAEKELDLFDKVILVTVSQTPNIRDLQGNMADMLHLRLEEESEKGRAQRLWLSLKEEKRILIIVDDLWKKFTLENIGIRLDNIYNSKSKVLVTSRSREICDSMGSQKIIQLSLLSEVEAWTLFQKHARIDDAFSAMSLNDVPRELCKECKGLPIAIVAVGSSLKGKSKAEWEVALHSLRHSEAIDDHVEEGVRAALSCLKLSYDYLRNKEAELLFLMCSMFPEDYEISIEDLIRYAMGLGLCRRFSCESARSQITVAINKLVDSCLLMHSGQSTDYVKMHDMVRDVALWIALRSEDHKIWVNIDKPLSTSAEDDGMRDYFAVSSWYNENQISLEVDCPNLEILLLNLKCRNSLDLSHALFEGMKGLKVFAVINQSYYPRPSLSLPQSTQLLTTLRTLRLNGWHLGDISSIGTLTRLEVLDLKYCNFNEISNQLGDLKRLKVLDFSFCQIQRTYNKAIGKFSQLEELYARECNFSLLSDSGWDIVTLPKLQRFVIQTPRNPYDYVEESTRALDLLNFNISNLGESKRNLLQIAEVVYLENLHGGSKNVIPDMVGVVGGINGLSSLRLHDCSEIECIIDTTSYDVDSHQVDALIPRLAKLELLELENLKELCRGPPLQLHRFFEKLEEVYIRHCEQLHGIFPWECNLCNLRILRIIRSDACCYRVVGRSTVVEVLFSMSVAQSLQQLEELMIEGCEELKHIIATGEHNSNTSKEIVPSSRSSHLVMPNLKRLSVNLCGNLESLLPISCVEGLGQLQEIEISTASKLKHVFGECDRGDYSCHQNENQIILPCLEVLILDNLQNLVGIYPENYRARWPSQTKLFLTDCPKWIER